MFISHWSHNKQAQNKHQKVPRDTKNCSTIARKISVSNKFQMKNRLLWRLQPFAGPLNHIEFMIFLAKALLLLAPSTSDAVLCTLLVISNLNIGPTIKRLKQREKDILPLSNICPLTSQKDPTRSKVVKVWWFWDMPTRAPVGYWKLCMKI